MWPRRRKDAEGEVVAATRLRPVIKPMSIADLNECWRLDQECFSDGEAYDRDTIRYLLSHARAVCFKAIDESGAMTAFVVGMIEPDQTGHVVALGVAPGFRRRGLGRRLMAAVEHGFARGGVEVVRLEVRTSNVVAQKLYLELGYSIVRRMPHYYSNGDDGFLMVREFAR